VNEGAVDRVIRVLAGLVILSFVFYRPKDSVGLVRSCTGLDRIGRLLPCLRALRPEHLQSHETL